MNNIPPDSTIVKTYYLYIKTHNQTGLKYLGYTSKKDPHRYPGSGKYWQNHLRKHGKDYTTEILLTTESLEEIREQGEYYSKLWQVVESKEWANLKAESGSGGAMSRESMDKAIETKRQNGTLNSTTPEIIAKILETKRNNGTLNSNTPESIAKRQTTMLDRYGKLSTVTPDSVKKAQATKQDLYGSTMPNMHTPVAKLKRKTSLLEKYGHLGFDQEAQNKAIETKQKNGTLHMNRSPDAVKQGVNTKLEKYGTLYHGTEESVARAMETRRVNGTLNTNTPESIAKSKETRKRNPWKHTPETKTRMIESRRRNQELKQADLMDSGGTTINPMKDVGGE
jgi:hypothetical protein